MDPTSPDQSDIAERYLSGDLTLREAREFEKYCLAHPEAVAQLPIPVRLKARLAGRRRAEAEALDEIATEDQPAPVAPETVLLVDDATPPRLRVALDRPLVIITLIATIVLLAAALALVILNNSTLRDRVRAVEDAARAVSLRPPSTLETFGLKPNRQGPGTEPDLALRWPDPPQLIQLRIDVSQGKYSTFAVTIDKLDEARILQIQRIAADSNRELKLALNSSAFGPGDYEIKIQAYTWRGEIVDYGWLRMQLLRQP